MRDASVILGVGLIVAGVSCYAGARIERWRAERVHRRRGVERVLRRWEMIREFSDRAKVAAFERAAQAVTMWPHRIDRRADLARHLLSLATVRDLSAPAPDAVDAPAALDAPIPESPSPAAAPVPWPDSYIALPDRSVMEGFL